ncbi:type VI secretion system baseplate subunit TssF [Pseudomonas sp. ZM23]|uniref:Type VI secretion system baseplate subunit TssF n=1 Tax=Pseudomonas triclosanedens TaxID=2961893 RepID=A0ABY6ZRY1_9PSED|nr:type VI secretion system baseplate subunit TssF [Pseudomonas triclosanedens]MCP8467006.1 type VI secretion system baseplate subunit TssF [Pseudomonas triclosanedens]MCP8472846.1 type VI secretion system baseplate subunit TssF [Pseudomonas triclosanedens]MCP8478277.1 type VI secretion system baseplate subunit TssF [Pseudomonas triclosanedens]WAI47682.1 type VI secretion system baseplate subunit TssF [Pseudomonas triclosanedens]
MSDSIDAELLDYYQRELTWLRHAGAGFAARYPKVARRLELGAGECADPHVERLLEGFALLAARLQRRLDDDYAQFSDALLEQLYPLALRPLPSCTIVQFEPDPTKGNLGAGYRLPRGTPLFVSVQGQERIDLPEELHGQTLHWRTTDEVTLWPLRIAEAVLLSAEEAQALTGEPAARAALRLDLRCLDADGWEALEIDSLRLHLCAGAVTNASLLDLIGAHSSALLAGPEGATPQRLRSLPRLVGFGPEQALLPEDDLVHPGLRLLAEYFAFPDKFAFVDVPLNDLRASGEQLYLYIVFDRAAPGRLPLQASDLALGCVPAVNLFPRTSEPLRPDGTQSEYRLVADAHRENSVEIHSLRSLRASSPRGVAEVPAYHGGQHLPGEQGLYWHARRVEGMTPNRIGSDLLLSLVDTRMQPLQDAPEYSLTAELLCTNRGLAERLPAGTTLGFERPGPVARASLLRAPSRQLQPRLDGPSRWQLVSQLTLNHLSLVEGPQALEALKEILGLHNFTADNGAYRQVEGLQALNCARVVDRVGEDAWRGWRNGLEVRLHLDRQAFVGASAVLFSAVLAQFFSLYANPNRFVRTVLVQSDQEIRRWQPQAGQPLAL